MKLLYPDPRQRRPRFEYPGSAGAGPQQQTKKQPTEREKIFANDATGKSLTSKIYKQLIQLNQKVGKRLKQTFLQRR